MSAKDIEIFKQRLAVDPLDRNAFLSLRNLYMRNGQFVELAQLYEMRSSYLGNTPESADLLFRAAELWLDQLGDVGRGTTGLLQTLEISPNHRPSAERLEKIYKESGDYQSLLQVLTKFVDGLESYEPGRESAKTRSSIYQQIGEIWETYYQRTDAAISFYKKAAQVDPTNVMAIYLARNIYCNAGDNETAARLYDLEINAEPDPERKKALLRELAILKERNLSDLEGAVVALRRAMVLSPNDPEVLYELGTALIRKNETEELTREEFEVAAECFFKLSQISEPDVGSRYLETALDLMPGHQGALEMYENNCVAERRWQDLKIRLQRSLDAITDRRQRIPILRKLGRLTFEQLDKPIEALAYLEALEEFGDPMDLDLLARVRVNVSPQPKSKADLKVEDEETLDQLMATGRQAAEDTAETSKEDVGAAMKAVTPMPLGMAAPPAGAPHPASGQERIATPLEAAASAAVPPPPRLPQADMEEVARLKMDAEKLVKLAMGEKAEEKMRKVLTMVPDDAQAWAFMEKRLRASGKFAELRDLLVESADSPYLSHEFKLDKLREAAALSETRLRDVDGTVRVYKKILGLNPDNADARKNLEKILVTNKKWDDYVTFLEETVFETTDIEQKLELHKKISEIHLLRRDDPKAASNSLWAALEIRPKDREVVGKLDELALRVRDWAELDKILKIELELEEDPKERRRIFDRLVSLQEETLEDSEGAYETCRQMNEEFPGELEILRRMARVETTSDRFKEALVTLEKIVEITPDDKEKAASLKKMARIAWDQFDDSDKSAEVWRRYLDLVPDDLEAYELYGELLESLNKSEDLIVIYRNLLEQEKLKDHHRFFMRKLGLLLSSDKVGRREEAMVVWKKLLEGGDDPEALRTLAIWHREKEEWDDLVVNLGRQLKLCTTNDDKVVTLKDMSEVLNEHLQKPNEAIDTLKQALALDEKDGEALTMLRSIYADIKDFPNAAAMLEKEIVLTQDASSQYTLLVQLAAWYREAIGDKVNAISAYERILQVAPSDVAALDALEVLYEEVGEWEKLLRLLRTKTRGTENEAEILGFLIKGAKICEENLGDHERSWGWYKEIFGRIAIDEDIMSVIEKAAERMNQWQDLASMYEDLAPKEADNESKVRRWRQAAGVLAGKLNDNARALNDVYQASLVDPDMVELLDEADVVALACQDWERLAVIYDRISRNLTDVDGRIMLLRRFAKIVWKEGKFPQGAVIPLLRATEERPEDNEIFDEFHKAALEAKEYEVLLEALDKRFKVATEKGDRIELKLRMSRIMAEYLKDIDGAIRIIREAVDVDPANERFAALIIDAARSIEDNLPPNEKGYVFSWLMKTYKQHADYYEASDPFRVIFLKQVAKIHIEGLEDHASGFATLREAHKLNPANTDILTELWNVAASRGYWEPLVDHLSDILHLSIKMEIAKLIHEYRAKVLEENLGRHEEAAEHYWQIIQVDPNHPYAFRKLADFYRSVGRYNDLLMLLESEVEKHGEQETKVTLLKEIASVWEKDMNNKFEAADVYKRVLALVPDEAESQAAIQKLQKTKLGLSLRLGEGEEEEEEEEEKVDIEELRRSLLDEEIEERKAEAEAAKRDTVPPRKEKSDRLPDWEDDIKTGEMPAQKVADILNKTDEGAVAEALDAETDFGGPAKEETATEEVGVHDLVVKPDAAPAAEARPSAPPEPLKSVPVAGPEPLDLSEFDDDIEPLPTDEEKPSAASSRKDAYVLDDDALKEVLQEEYELPQPAPQPASPPAPQPVAQQAVPEPGRKSVPPPAPKTGKRRKVVAAPPPPTKKK